MQRLHVIVSGRVQGVWYRGSTQERARQLRLTGWVRNLPDGTVELVAEGPGEQLQLLLDWCHEGPPSAVVAGVQSDWRNGTDEFWSFDVR